MKIQLVVFFVIIGGFSFCQTKEDIRFPFQKYFEDSVNVFFTWFPNPFTPKTVTDSTKNLFCYEYTFYCDLSDTVLMAFQNESDSIFYSCEVITKKPPYFSPCFWIAGSNFDQSKLPEKYFRGDGTDKVFLSLMVNGRKKCYKEIGVVNLYYWLREN